MHLADLALDTTLDRLGGARATRYVLYLPGELRPAAPDFGLPFDYALLRGRLAAALDADAILYWGDFLHSRHYRQAVANLLVRIGAATDLAVATTIVDDHFFLRSTPADRLGRVVSFGECLLTDDDSGVRDLRYDELLHRFFAGVRGAWMRDPISAARVDGLRGDDENHLGVDAAALLCAEDYRGIIADAAPRPEYSGSVAVFFARTNVDPRRLLGLAHDLATALGAPVAWLPWFTEGALDETTVRALAPGIAASFAPPSLAQLLADLWRCRLVVTDAYHLCLTAWNLGVPAVCIGRGAVRFATALSDKKKEMFCATYGAEDFLVFAEQLEGDARTVPPLAARIVRLASDGTFVRSIQTRIADHRDRAERALHGRLKEILDV